MKTAIVGSGISGLTAAHFLHPQHEITVFEAGSHIGGHTNTVSVDLEAEHQEIDTGFIVCNDRTYPNFLWLLDELNVATQPTEMSFSVRSDRERLEYNGSSLTGLFAQPHNLLRPGFYRMLRDTMRFFRIAPDFLSRDDHSLTVEEYCRKERFSREFVDWHLVPMGAAIWSASPRGFLKFPVRFVIQFYQNHGLLGLRNRPEWRVISGGSARYVEAMVRPFRDRIRLNAPVERVERLPLGVRLKSRGEWEEFDHLIFACHSDQALNLLSHPDPLEVRTLKAIPYQKNIAVLHTDTRMLPKSRRAWASWNYLLGADPNMPATVTYNMNILQHLKSRHTWCVTLNREEGIDPARIFRRITYAHPVFTTERAWAHSQRFQMIDRQGISYCGAYWGNGFHEDGVNSALAVVNAFQQPHAEQSWKAAFTPAG